MGEQHLRCGPADIADVVMLVGDPNRAERVAALFGESRLVNSNRGLLVYTGFYADTRLTVATTAMGGPSAAIVLEELCNLGASIFIRVGSAGGLASQLVAGDIVVATAAVRDEGTSMRYLKPTFPAIGDFDLTGIVVRLAKESRPETLPGIVLTHDAFYRGLSKEALIELREAGVVAREMETACVFVVAAVRRVRAAALLAIGGNLLNPEERSAKNFAEAEQTAIRIGLDALVEASRAGLAKAR
jgi:DeoD family purine-nucleoside phosphorylase